VAPRGVPRHPGNDPPLCVVDEAYRDFCDDLDTVDGVDLVRRHPTAIAFRTFSKIAGLAVCGSVM